MRHQLRYYSFFGLELCFCFGVILSDLWNVDFGISFKFIGVPNLCGAYLFMLLIMTTSSLVSLSIGISIQP